MIGKKLADAIKKRVTYVWSTPKGRIFISVGGCLVTAVCIAVVVLHTADSPTITKANVVQAKPDAVTSVGLSNNSSEITSSSTSIPIVVEKVTASSSAPSSAPSSHSQNTASEKVTKSSSSADTHYVQVQNKEESSSSSTASLPASSSSNHIKNYQGVNKQKTYTDEITGSQESVQFLGVGAGYQEVAIAEIQFQTSADMGAAHYGVATATLTGPVPQSTPAVVYKSGTCSLFTVGNLTAGTYEVKLTAHDGTDVVRFHITVDTGGIVQ